MSESEKAAAPTEVQSPGLRTGGGRRKARAGAGTEFHGVCWRPGGKFGARIREDAAAARMHMHGATARPRTNFKEPAAIDDGGVSSLLHFLAELSSQGARTGFRGVCRRPSGKFTARIYKGRAETWLGTFDTAEEAARAFDAAAIKMRGAAARTNFKQPTANDDGGVSPLPAEPSGQGMHRHPSGKHIALSLGSLGGFDTPGVWHDHLSVDLPPAEWQQVEELLKDMDSSDAQDREALIEAAAILQHISLAGHGDDGSAAAK